MSENEPIAEDVLSLKFEPDTSKVDSALRSIQARANAIKPGGSTAIGGNVGKAFSNISKSMADQGAGKSFHLGPAVASSVSSTVKSMVDLDQEIETLVEVLEHMVEIDESLMEIKIQELQLRKRKVDERYAKKPTEDLDLKSEKLGLLIRKEEMRLLKSKFTQEEKQRKQEEYANRSQLKKLWDKFGMRFFARYSKGHVYTGTGGNISGAIGEMLGLGGGKGIFGGNSTASATKGATGAGATAGTGAVAAGASTAGASGAGAGAGASTAAASGAVAVGTVATAGILLAILAALLVILVIAKGIKNSESFKALSEMVGLIGDSIMSTFVMLYISIKQLIEWFKDRFETWTQWIDDNIYKRINTFMSDIDEDIEGMISWIDEAYTKIRNFDLSVWTKDNIVDPFKDAFDDVKVKFREKFVDPAVASFEVMKEQFFQKILGPITSGYTVIKDVFKTKIKDPIVSAYTTIKTKWDENVQPKLDYIIDIPGKLYNMFNRGLIIPLGQGLENLINGIIGAINGVIGSLPFGLGDKIGYVGAVNIVDENGLVI